MKKGEYYFELDDSLELSKSGGRVIGVNQKCAPEIIAFWSEVDACWVAVHNQFESIKTHGATLKEAFEEMRSVLDAIDDD
tara:strand:+ start:211 stop:450 length:240 start_codon:yes stop_codon:yes gene_type:complete